MRFGQVVVFCGVCVLMGLSLANAQAQTSVEPPQIPPPVSNPAQSPSAAKAAPSTTGAPASARSRSAAGSISAPATPLYGNIYGGDAQADPNTSLILDNADTLVETKPGQWTGRGNVKVEYKGYVLTSDRVDADLDTGEALFSGNVVLHSPNSETVEGGETGTLQLNLRQSTYTIIGARSTVQPEALDIGIIAPIYIYGGVIHGRPGFIDARGSSFTTCDFVEPHYSFSSPNVYIIPGKRLVARDVTLYRKDRRIITIPYLVVPLDQRNARQTLVPEVGQSPDEGYFIKFALGYALASSLPGILHLDAMQYKGIGTGFDQYYGSPNKPKQANGEFSLYHLSDQQTGLQDLTGTLRNSQQIGNVGLTLNSQFERNSYYAGEAPSNSLNTQLNLTRSVGNLDSTLLTTLTTENYGAGTTSTLTAALSQTFKPTNNETLQTKLDFSQFITPSFLGSTGATAQRELDTNLDYMQRGKAFDIELLGADFAQIGSSTTGSSFSNGVERLPEIRLSTDAKRADWLALLFPSTTKLNLSLGDFVEEFSKTNTERVDVDLDLGTTAKRIDSRDTFTYGGSFQQAFYGDDTAQYILNGQTGYRLRIGGKSSVGVTYTYLRPYGYTPFAFDQTGATNTTSLSLNYQETKALQVTLATGYDFNRDHTIDGIPGAPWQSVSLQTIYTPNKIFAFRTTATYDLNSNILQNVSNSFRVRASGGTSLDLADQYVPQQHEFSTINGSLDFPLFHDPHEDSGYRIRALGSYDGYSKTFQYKGLALTRDWHDWEATLVYEDDPEGIRPGSTVTFNFQLRAFPSYQPFGVGQFGQALDTSIGEVY